ncbi:LysR substrate-binding domain-containing protein [Aliiroseovarius sp. KMU-50]|uniref:LysR substrate-binding domain-containing protein n=1 Tax=Aliiroseovarius salicola TaxID=3009082 RepID=A0ABT4W1X8_9RHOB|nr:LysR substrate-binding domain-containing protein [Aliiroseovarius sp. KMU-50]MDA5094505.1 LysR substrate-binding domain-containing protein [Aliiroseovarius sp. KMU-50]
MTQLPLNALRAFEAAARHGGYIDAAEELFVTRGAISRHVKLLEEQLGLALFRRSPRGVELTESGASLLPVLSEAFASMEREIARLTENAGELRIICPPALSIRWLFPRLDDFRARHPDIRVRLTTEFYGDTGFDAQEYDVGISVENWSRRGENTVAQPLFPMRISPACSPSFLARHRLPAPAQLGQVTILHESRWRGDWATWVDRFANDDTGAQLDINRGEVFPNFDMAVKAAVIGTGVVMADLELCRDELESGALVLPFPEMICGTRLGSYALISSEDKWNDPKVQAFRDWAHEVCAEHAT